MIIKKTTDQEGFFKGREVYIRIYTDLDVVKCSVYAVRKFKGISKLMARLINNKQNEFCKNDELVDHWVSSKKRNIEDIGDWERADYEKWAEEVYKEAMSWCNGVSKEMQEKQQKKKEKELLREKVNKIID